MNRVEPGFKGDQWRLQGRSFSLLLGFFSLPTLLSPVSSSLSQISLQPIKNKTYKFRFSAVLVFSQALFARVVLEPFTLENKRARKPFTTTLQKPLAKRRRNQPGPIKSSTSNESNKKCLSVQFTAGYSFILTTFQWDTDATGHSEGSSSGCGTRIVNF